jgi:3-dehydroquinate synthetase
MGQDKKTRLGRLRLVLARALGDAFMCEDIEPAPLVEVIEQSLNSATTAPRPVQSADV